MFNPQKIENYISSILWLTKTNVIQFTQQFVN